VLVRDLRLPVLAQRPLSVSDVMSLSSHSSQTRPLVSELSLGSAAPDIVAPASVDGVLRMFYLSEFSGKFILLLFYPTDFPTVAIQELTDFAAGHENFLQIDCELAAISTDSHYDHLAYWRLAQKQGGLGRQCAFPLISDFREDIASRYGMLDISTNLCHRGSVLIDPWGIIRMVTYHGNAVARKAKHLYDITAAQRILVGRDRDDQTLYCPGGWEPGDDLFIEYRHTDHVVKLPTSVEGITQIPPSWRERD